MCHPSSNATAMGMAQLFSVFCLQENTELATRNTFGQLLPSTGFWKVTQKKKYNPMFPNYERLHNVRHFLEALIDLVVKPKLSFSSWPPSIRNTKHSYQIVCPLLKITGFTGWLRHRPSSFRTQNYLAYPEPKYAQLSFSYGNQNAQRNATTTRLRSQGVEALRGECHQEKKKRKVISLRWVKSQGSAVRRGANRGDELMRDELKARL